MTPRIFKYIFAAILLSGCSTYSLEELRHTTPSGSEFQKTLAKLYMDFADDEEKDYDWRNSWHFADKGLLAAYGKDVAPEDIGEWDLPPEALPEMEKARGELLSALTPENIRAKPAAAARAQFNFDCWVEQQEEGWQADDIAACRDGFNKAVSELMPGSAGKYGRKEEKKSGKPFAAVKKLAPATTSFIVFFDTGKTVFTEAGESSLAEVVKALEKQKNYVVVINDHHCKQNMQKPDRELLQERGEYVRKRLIESGINPSAIINCGESRKQANRIIEIILND
jgi:OOP family OmpA-OmpF porin